jgi:hypothetical protein
MKLLIIFSYILMFMYWTLPNLLVLRKNCILFKGVGGVFGHTKCEELKGEIAFVNISQYYSRFVSLVSKTVKIYKSAKLIPCMHLVKCADGLNNYTCVFSAMDLITRSTSRRASMA